MFKKKKLQIPLDKFITNSLYHPKNGYYMRKIPFGKKGDFITSPNISIFFSEMIFIWLISYWEKFYKNKKINIIELGAGNGEMMRQIILSSKRFTNFYNKCEFMIFEKSKKLIQVQKKNLKNEKVIWTKNLEKLDNRPTIFIGNEFLDALPIKQFLKIKNQWYERYVCKIGNDYNFTNIKCNITKVEKKLKIKISKNQNFLEVSFEGIKIIEKISKIINKKGGCILLIDYAYLNRKMVDTIQAVKNHKKIDIFKHIGNADITHIVNIPFLKKAAKKLKLKFNYNTQRKFLLSLGILRRADVIASKKNFLEKANIFYRINRLIDERQMGNLFKVMYFYKKNNKFNLGFK